ncbi:hypothetical protein B9C99_24040 [Rhodococcus sp. BUPNP1]|nr:hypothetical protein B9C99_24040 [Rhodococcus sp. BUPNP1]
MSRIAEQHAASMLENEFCSRSVGMTTQAAVQARFLGVPLFPAVVEYGSGQPLGQRADGQMARIVGRQL